MHRTKCIHNKGMGKEIQKEAGFKEPHSNWGWGWVGVGRSWVGVGTFGRGWVGVGLGQRWVGVVSGLGLHDNYAFWFLRQFLGLFWFLTLTGPN